MDDEQEAIAILQRFVENPFLELMTSTTGSNWQLQPALELGVKLSLAH